jgi:hypothetical protein
MSRQRYRYFMIPVASVPSQPKYTVWFASWSEKRSEYLWSRKRPDTRSGTADTWVIGATDDADLPTEATAVLAMSDKCIDPPPLRAPLNATSAELQAMLTKQLSQAFDGSKSL